MAKTVEQMLQQVRRRTGRRGQDPKLLDELNNALDWLWPRLYAVNPNLEITFGTTGTFSADTQTFDLGAAIAAGELYGLKGFWVKRSGDEDYVPVRFMSSGRLSFVLSDQDTASVTTPVLADVINFDQIRFSPAMPSGAGWRADWIGKPAPFNLDDNADTTVPDTFAAPLVDRSIAVLFNLGDDDKDNRWFIEADASALRCAQVNKRRQFQNRRSTATYPRR